MLALSASLEWDRPAIFSKPAFASASSNRTRSRAEELRGEGAEVADSPAGAGKGEIVIIMLADDNAVEEIVLGSGRVITALKKGAIHLSMSTITVALSEKLTEAHCMAGQHFVAAPVFGRPEAAAMAKLYIVAAGEVEPLDRCQPLFDALGQKTFIVGELPPNANLVKLAGNFLVASVIESLGEAVALMRKSGVVPQRTCRDPDRQPLCRSGLRNLRRTDRERTLSTGGF